MASSTRGEKESNMVGNRIKHRNRNQFTFNLRPGLVKLQGSITFDAGLGAVSSDGYALRGLNEGAAADGGPAVTKLATGKWRLRFADDYLGMNAFSFATEHATATDGYNVICLDSSKIASDKYIDLQIVNNSNAAADLIDCKLWLEFSMKTSELG